MNILFIADPMSSFKTYKDTTYAMMREMARRNWHLSHATAADLSIKDRAGPGRNQNRHLLGV